MQPWLGIKITLQIHLATTQLYSRPREIRMRKLDYQSKPTPPRIHSPTTREHQRQLTALFLSLMPLLLSASGHHLPTPLQRQVLEPLLQVQVLLLVLKWLSATMLPSHSTSRPTDQSPLPATVPLYLNSARHQSPLVPWPTVHLPATSIASNSTSSLQWMMSSDFAPVNSSDSYTSMTMVG